MTSQHSVAVVTGATSGIGRISALTLAQQGWHTVLIGRNARTLREVAAEITGGGGTAAVVQMDLTSLDSVRSGASEIAAAYPRIDVLINNAGVAGHRGLTVDGFEIHFGVNHLAHFLLTSILLPRLLHGAPSRIVNVSSESHSLPRALDLESVLRPTRSITGLPEYGLSKLCNILFTLELRHRLAGTGVICTSVHPGRVATRVWRRIPQPFRWIATRFMLSEQQGADHVLQCALDPVLWNNAALYYDQGRPTRPAETALDPMAAKRLWDASSRWVGVQPLTEVPNDQRAM